MSEFEAVIAYSLDGVNNKSIILDTIEDTTVSGSAMITSQPMVNGDMISDHMYNEPKSLSLNGSISLNGSKVTVVDGNGSKLANFEELFENIQRKGILCEIYKISVDNNEEIRFLHRKNMVLNTFSWTEGINDLSFSLSFKEVLTTEVVVYNVDVDDKLLPNINKPITLSFTNTLIDWDKIDKAIVDILEKEALWTNNFKSVIRSMDQSTMSSIIGKVLGIAVAAVVAALVGSVGSLLLGIGIVAIFIIGINKIIQEQKRRLKYKIEVFDAYKNPKKTDSEIRRFGKFTDGIHKSFEGINSSIQVYKVSENVAQEVPLETKEQYYVFNFNKNNTDGNYYLSIENMDESIVVESFNLKGSKTDFSQLTSSDAILTTKSGESFYVINPNEKYDDLTEYYIVICDFNVDDFQNIIIDIINKSIFR